MNGSPRRALLTTIGTSGLFDAGRLKDELRTENDGDDEYFLLEYWAEAASVDYEDVVVTYPTAVEHLHTLDVIETTSDWRERDHVADRVTTAAWEVAEFREDLSEEETAVIERANMDEDSLILISNIWGQVMHLDAEYVGVTESDHSYVELDYELEGAMIPHDFAS